MLACLIGGEFVQARSELVDTAGSAFYRECHDALANGEFRSLLSKFIEQIDLIFEKASSSGETQAPSFLNILKFTRCQAHCVREAAQGQNQGELLVAAACASWKRLGAQPFGSTCRLVILQRIVNLLLRDTLDCHTVVLNCLNCKEGAKCRSMLAGDAETAICVIVHLLKALPEGQHSDYALKLASAVAAKVHLHYLSSTVQSHRGI